LQLSVGQPLVKSACQNHHNRKISRTDSSLSALLIGTSSPPHAVLEVKAAVPLLATRSRADPRKHAALPWSKRSEVTFVLLESHNGTCRASCCTLEKLLLLAVAAATACCSSSSYCQQPQAPCTRLMMVKRACSSLRRRAAAASPALRNQTFGRLVSVRAQAAATAKAGDFVAVDYTGTLDDGTVFDSSRKEGRTPLEFVVGGGMVSTIWCIVLYAFNNCVTREQQQGHAHVTYPAALCRIVWTTCGQASPAALAAGEAIIRMLCCSRGCCCGLLGQLLTLAAAAPRPHSNSHLLRCAFCGQAYQLMSHQHLEAAAALASLWLGGNLLHAPATN
jgi:hypothetical protein